MGLRKRSCFLNTASNSDARLIICSDYCNSTNTITMNKIILPIWLTLAVITCRAQSIGTRTVNSTGATTSAGGLVLEWSVGEMVTVQTLTSPNVMLTQGLLQPGASLDAPLPVTLLSFKGKAI